MEGLSGNLTMLVVAVQEECQEFLRNLRLEGWTITQTTRTTDDRMDQTPQDSVREASGNEPHCKYGSPQ